MKTYKESGLSLRSDCTWDNDDRNDYKSMTWLWEKGRIAFVRGTGDWKKVEKWSAIRLRNAFYNIADRHLMRLTMKYNGQSRAEFEKNYKRIEDIIEKAAGDDDKAIRLATTQANKIHDEWKAINRAMAAKEKGRDDIFEVFFHRAYELGSVTTQEYREYVLDKLGI